MNLRELKYVLLGDDRLSGKLKQVSQSGDQAARSLRNSSNRLAQFKKNAREAANEIPGVGRAMSLAKNPIVLGTAALAAFGAVAKRASNEAAKFNSNFRELANLNLDKGFNEIGGLRNLVQTTAFDKGFDQNKTSKAFYDVQSVTGKYGGEVSRIVATQGEFANLMKADFNSWIEGTGKAMANFGFGAEKLNEFNKAAFATVKVGSITFDQLAKVQSAYAGAAASAGQSFQAANKMLTVFTVKTKSADEASTLTKSLFNDLTKKSTEDALNSVGIKLYDANDKIKQADQLMIELNEKFIELGGSDRRIMNLKNQFRGSEGLIQFVQAATEQSGSLIRTLTDFDSTDIAFNKALALARKDIDYINDQLQNKLNVQLARLGENTLKMRGDITNALISVLEADNIRRTGVDVKARQDAGSKAKQDFDHLISKAPEMTPEEYNNAIGQIREGLRMSIDQMKKYERHQNAYMFNQSKKYAYHFFGEYGKTLADIIDIMDAARRGKSIPGYTSETNAEDPTDPLNKGLQSVAGGGNAIRNITVNITKLIESQNINTKNLTEGQADIQRLVEEALMRAIAGTEQMLN